jgi:hypothetical protein
VSLCPDPDPSCSRCLLAFGATVSFYRSLTLLWPGLPWVWLRGSRAGLILAVAFAVCLDMAVVNTWIWTEFVDLRVTLGIWAAAAVIWLVATASALAAFPPPLTSQRDATSERLFVTARDAYLARDWLTAETKLQALLTLCPTDGEAQLLLGTLLRRAGRFAEAKTALEKLARSDAGIPWRHAIRRELQCLKRSEQEQHEATKDATLPLPSEPLRRQAAA